MDFILQYYGQRAFNKATPSTLLRLNVQQCHITQATRQILRTKFSDTRHLQVFGHPTASPMRCPASTSAPRSPTSTPPRLLAAPLSRRPTTMAVHKKADQPAALICHFFGVFLTAQIWGQKKKKTESENARRNSQ